jgi:hypothetical protein
VKQRVGRRRQSGRDSGGPSARAPRLFALAIAVILVTSAPAAQEPGPADLLNRVGRRVEAYFGRVRSLVCTEKVRVQEIGSDLAPQGFARTLEYDVRVEWPSSTEGRGEKPVAVRQLKRVNGRTTPDAEPRCMDPPRIGPEPLAFLMPERREAYAFSFGGSGRGRSTSRLSLEYRSRNEGRPEVAWRDDCAHVSFPGWTQGHVWIDPTNDDVLRVDEGLIRPFEYRVPADLVRLGFAESWVLERADSSVRYRPVTFRDPDATVLLPETIDTLVVFRGPGVTSHRTSHTFSECRRFLTEGRIVN